MRTSTGPLLVAAAALVVGVLGASTLHSQEAPAPVRVGFVNLEKAFAEYRRVKDIEGEAKARIDAIGQSVRSEREEIESMLEQLQTLNPGTDEFEALQRQIELRRYALKRDEDYARKRLGRRVERMQALVYREIVAEAQAYAEELGLGAVLSRNVLKEGFERNVDLDKLLTARTVLWADDSLDITDPVLERLNAMLPPPSGGTPPNRIDDPGGDDPGPKDE
jgi:Skp family chaperone for outer membrane proteins